MYSCIIISVQHVNKAVERILVSVFVQAYFIVSDTQKYFPLPKLKKILFFVSGSRDCLSHGPLIKQDTISAKSEALIHKRQRRCCLFPIGLCTSGIPNYLLISRGPGPRHAKEQLKRHSSKNK